MLGVTASAAAAPPAIKNLFTFDVMKPTAKCAKVTGALQTKLTKRYTCLAPDDPTASASGKTMIAECKAKQGESMYMVMATAKDCETERATQLANGA
jgi:hypothetical protein